MGVGVWSHAHLADRTVAEPEASCIWNHQLKFLKTTLDDPETPRQRNLTLTTLRLAAKAATTSISRSREKIADKSSRSCLITHSLSPDMDPLYIILSCACPLAVCGVPNGSHAQLFSTPWARPALPCLSQHRREHPTAAATLSSTSSTSTRKSRMCSREALEVMQISQPILPLFSKREREREITCSCQLS